ncbi:MAG: YhjD/YihY/BrkB family envelope integrity protein, partial [bacterium]|nr:YhjD/YihY/BrkB family envelope integrity protein [bacterium]
MGKSYQYFSQARGTRQAAALTFYTLFSLAPILLVAVALIGLFLQNRVEEILGEILIQAGQFLGPRAVDMLRTLLEKLSWERDSWWATIIGVLLTLFGATTVFSSLKESLNELWSVRPSPEINSLKFFFQTRLISILAVLILGMLFIVLFFLSVLVSGFDQYLSGKLELPLPLLFLINNFSLILVM